MNAPSPSKLQRAGRGLLVALGLCGLLEAGLRAIGFEYQPMEVPLVLYTRDMDEQMDSGEGMFRPSKELLWECVPGARVPSEAPAERINEMGFRGEVLPPKKGPDHVRIVCLGDSSTFGAHVEADETFSAVLERKLRDGGMDADVLNAGIIGYSSQQSRILLEQRLLDLRPDVVVLYLGAINDGRPAKPLPDRPKLAQMNAPTPLVVHLNRAVQHLRLGQLVRYFIAPQPSWKALLKDQGYTRMADEAARDGTYTMRVPLDEFRDNVTACVQEVRDIGARPILVVPSRKERLEEETPFQVRYSEAMAALGKELGVPCLDARAAVRAAPGGTEAHHYSESRVHPSPAGHELIATMLAEAIRAELAAR